MTKTVLVAAGGTGGHLFPAAAFSEEMRARGWKVVLMTDARGRRYAENFPADSIEDVPAATLQGDPLKMALASLTIMRGMAAARGRLKLIDPSVVTGFGGYPSLPSLAAAQAQRRPILIHEQNSVLGRVNRRYAKVADIVACGFERLDLFPNSAKARKIVTGNPVRPAVLQAREKPYVVAAPGEPIRLLVIGGSQGARIFGEVIPAAIGKLDESLKKRLQVTQQVREEQVEEVKRAYSAMGVQAQVSPFFKDMGDRLAACHLVIARAGASTVTELQAVGRPSILVPLAIAADDHQTANAEALTGIGAADALNELSCKPDALAALLAKRFADPHDLSVRAAAAKASGRPDAAKRLANLAEELGLPRI
jgi:UDP-N-acetylglucosamine--N-acetylmuramyl-(pentapeptide) pyrophosphoryl-undecaprenol N-acetylglucosamine transferase